MKLLELEAKRTQIINEIDSEELLDKVQKYIQRIKKGTEAKPCRYSLDELKERLIQGVVDAQSGLGTSQEDMRKLHPRK